LIAPDPGQTLDFRAQRSLRVFYASEYELATPALAATARKDAIDLDQRFPDHAPLTIDYDFRL